MQKTCSASGGDEILAAQISVDPQNAAIFDTYTQWEASAQSDTASPPRLDVTGLSTQTIWSVVAGAGDVELAKREADLKNAYEYITTHPRIHKTKCALTIGSDWGDMNLLTPSAYINVDEGTILPEGAYWSSTKIGWRDLARPRTVTLQ